jgi:hypothetical protein
MRRMRVAVPSICFFAVAGACATTAPGTSRFATSPEPQHLTPAQFMAQQDSAAAQRIANEAGPGASIRAEYSTVSGMRRVVASFHVDADAYVLVGHIDADGILRVAFPLDPRDDGFVRGNRDYSTPEFFAGFADEYHFRAQQYGFRSAARPIDSYDGGLGYAFIVASWRPLRFDQFQTDGRWDSFELADDKYMNDPRPAIYELASLLAGQNREAYTVAFAKYTTTMALAGYGGGSAYAFGYGDLQYCLGYGPGSFGFSNVWSSTVTPVGLENAWGYPSAFYSRGQYYFYDDLAGCYRSAYQGGYYAPYYGFGRIASGGPGPVPATPMRGFKPRDRSPDAPKALGIHTLPLSQLGASDANGHVPTSSSYRQRGLITADEPGTAPAPRKPSSIDAHAQIENHTRPSIQDMVNRHPETPSEKTEGWARGQTVGHPAATERPSSTAPESRRPEPSAGTTRTYQTPQNETRSAPPPHVETRTYQPPPQTETRSAPPAPRPAPEIRVPESRPASPPPAPPAQSQPPASSSSSNPPATGSRPPR